MKTKRLWILPFFLTGLIPSTGSTQSAAPVDSPVLVELFTSQGCSSCPPAEKLLNEWGMDLFKRRKIVPLAFHVDYWDYLGWKDPYSSLLFTTRQRDYAHALRSDSLYTPQMVVAGKAGFVGSDALRVRQEVAAAQIQKPGYHFSLKVQKEKDGLHLKVSVFPSKLTGIGFYIALFENGLSTKVLRGENAGSLLMENFVVRSLVGIKTSEASGKLEALVPWDPVWNISQCGVVVFAQDKETMETKGAKCLFPLTTAQSEKVP